MSDRTRRDEEGRPRQPQIDLPEGPDRGEFEDVDTESPQLPEGAYLVQIGTGAWRVVWDLGDGLGWAWYVVREDDLEGLFGTDSPEAHYRVNSFAQFQGEFGHAGWGDISEVNLSAGTPWEDLKDRIFDQFGFVPGMDEIEVRRLLIQAYFENWNAAQFENEYHQTDYWNSLNQRQREWQDLSDREKDQRTRQIALDMARDYKRLWGRTDKGPGHWMQGAREIARGAILYDEWFFKQERSASQTEDTPAWRDRRQEQEDARREQNEIENMGKHAEDRFRVWVGPGQIPDNFRQQWGNWLASGERSQADLEDYLRELSMGRWQHKPENVTWQDWAGSYKNQIMQTLELATLDDNDKLLNRILNNPTEGGVDITKMIRHDSRFLETNTFADEISNKLTNIGRMFGFIA